MNQEVDVEDESSVRPDLISSVDPIATFVVAIVGTDCSAIGLNLRLIHICICAEEILSLTYLYLKLLCP
jgi:hypothetical protein